MRRDTQLQMGDFGRPGQQTRCRESAIPKLSAHVPADDYKLLKNSSYFRASIRSSSTALSPTVNLQIQPAL